MIELGGVCARRMVDSLHFFFFMFMYLAAPGHSCDLWDPVPWPGLPALGVCNLSHWTTREVPHFIFLPSETYSFYLVGLTYWLFLHKTDSYMYLSGLRKMETQATFLTSFGYRQANQELPKQSGLAFFVSAKSLQSFPALCDPVDHSVWDFPDENTGVGCQASSRGSSQQRSNLRLLCLLNVLYNACLKYGYLGNFSGSQPSV